MNSDPYRDDLLGDVLAEAVTPSFRAGVLARMLTELRRRRERRQRIKGIMAACLVLIFGVAVRFIFSQHQPASLKADGFEVHSQRLNPGMVVATQPEAVAVVKTTATSVILVETMPAGKLFEFIGENQLLALLGSRPAALVHHGVLGDELLLLNPADAQGFQVP